MDRKDKNYMQAGVVVLSISAILGIGKCIAETIELEEKLSVGSNADATTTPSSGITFTYNEPGAFVQLHPDGKVTWDGELDKATLLFWRSVTKVFPAFKAEICNK